MDVFVLETYFVLRFGEYLCRVHDGWSFWGLNLNILFLWESFLPVGRNARFACPEVAEFAGWLYIHFHREDTESKGILVFCRRG